MRKLIFLFLLTAAGIFAQVSPIPLIGFDEFGNAWMNDPSNALPCVMMADPGPNGLANALNCSLDGPPAMIAGDLLLYADPGLTILSDILRFNPQDTAPGYPFSVVIYSALDTQALADTGFPLGLYTNVVSMQEVNNGVFYMPTDGQPGFVPGFSVGYSFTGSADTLPDPPAAPEPATVSLFLVAGGVLIAAGRARKG